MALLHNLGRGLAKFLAAPRERNSSSTALTPSSTDMAWVSISRSASSGMS